MNRVLISAVLLVYACSSVLAQESTPTFAVGDHWTYHYVEDGADRDNYTETVRAVDGTTVELFTVHPDGSQTLALYDGLTHRYLQRYALRPNGQRGAVLSDSSGNEAPIRFPLQVNDEYAVVYHFSVRGTALTRDYRATVVGRESVKTPAGTFEAYKVVLKGYGWVDAAVMSSRSRQMQTYWYVPAVKRFVRREIVGYGSGASQLNTMVYSRTDELVEYHVGP